MAAAARAASVALETAIPQSAFFSAGASFTPSPVRLNEIRVFLPARNPRAWAPLLAPYREPSSARSTVELVITAVPLVILWILMWAALGTGYWIGLLLAVPAAGFLVRLFMIQHDCGHGSFFRGRLANDWVGRIIGVLTLTPYDFWRHSHALHHANSGNLDHREFGDVDTLTVREFLALSRWRQLLYRLYRHPIVIFALVRRICFFCSTDCRLD